MMLFAGMVELADTLDLGSNGIAVQVQVLLPAPRRRELRIVCGGVFYFAFSLLRFHITVVPLISLTTPFRYRIIPLGGVDYDLFRSIFTLHYGRNHIQ